MRFELSADVFTDDGFEHIAFLIRYFSEGRHEWIVGMPQLSAIEDYFREQVPKRAEVWIALARKATVSEVWTAGPARPDGMTITRKSLADDVHDLGLAARVVLENGDGDGDFVLAIAYVLGAERITKAKERHWLKFVHGGGSGEVPKVVRREHEEFRRTIRVTFLLDSDRMTPEERSKHEAAVEELRDVGIHGHVLRYREIENYVPNRVLAAATVPRPREVPLTERIDSLKTLTCDQRAHFDMKKGFADRKKEERCLPGGGRVCAAAVVVSVPRRGGGARLVTAVVVSRRCLLGGGRFG